ncbi:MAG TPA: hypothetical protein DDX91_07825 [Ruminococcaceae bacterium]|nr:hypothetical protein [Oscillospiraceae bacterium]
MQKKKIIALSVLAAVLASASLLLYKNSHLLYIAGEYLGVSCKRVSVEKTEPENLVDFTLEELEQRENTAFNQSLMLVNNRHMLMQGFVPDVSEYKKTGVFMNSCMQKAYGELSAAVTEKTESRLYVSSDLRSYEEQQEVFAQTPDVAIQPGASEHQTGLALDVYVKNFAGEGFIKSEAGRFVNSESWRYGFIIRYPSFGKEKTEITFEPWHIRYVGEPHAKIIYNNHITLEEYIQSLEKNIWYKSEDCLISRQELSEDGRLKLPRDYSEAVISPDNTGCLLSPYTDFCRASASDNSKTKFK